MEDGTYLREHIPLKQGLRLLLPSCAQRTRRLLREHIPLKQGLRQFILKLINQISKFSESIFH